MNDDWRIRATLTSDSRASELGDLLQSGDVQHDLETAPGDRVVVSVDDHELYLYASSREQAERGADALRKAADQRGWQVTVELRRWHPVAEEWENPDAPLPATDDDREREHAELIEHERVESKRYGFSEFEVRIACSSHHDTVELSHRLRAEGVPYVRRWRYLLVGATDEESAAALAERLSAETPAGCTVTWEGSLAAVNAETPSNPFAVFGGLGG